MGILVATVAYCCLLRFCCAAAAAAAAAAIIISTAFEEGGELDGCWGGGCVGCGIILALAWPTLLIPPLVLRISSSCFLRCNESLIISKVCASRSTMENSFATLGVHIIFARSMPRDLRTAFNRLDSAKDISECTEWT